MRDLGSSPSERSMPPPEVPPDPHYPDIDSDEQFVRIYGSCRPYTMTSIERMYALYKATAYVALHGIPGDLVECGAWRGGSAMLMAYTLLELGGPLPKLHLYDTFAGMPPADRVDVDVSGRSANELLETSPRTAAVWAVASMDEVAANMRRTGYPPELVDFVPGRVEDTLPDRAPTQVSLLHLDTDWYASTKHELTHLFPRLSAGGVLIIDDYGHWRGARAATDWFFAQCREPVLLTRIDYTGRIAVRLGRG